MRQLNIHLDQVMPIILLGSNMKGETIIEEEVSLQEE
jgi:hypothetical protein